MPTKLFMLSKPVLFAAELDPLDPVGSTGSMTYQSSAGSWHPKAGFLRFAIGNHWNISWASIDTALTL